MAKKTIFISVAVLAAFALDEQRYRPGQVVEFATDTANSLADQGLVDKHKAAIAYNLAQGAIAIRHPYPEEEVEQEDLGENAPATNTQPLQTSAQSTAAA